jgi:transcriptional/translational regulatory protein YebC/TACO1
MFSRKAVFVFELPEEIDQEELEFDLIDAGLERLETENDKLVAYAEFTQYGNLSKALEEKGIDVEKATLERIPNSPVEFTDEQLEDIEKMLDKIEEDDDVQQVFTNIA